MDNFQVLRIIKPVDDDFDASLIAILHEEVEMMLKVFVKKVQMMCSGVANCVVRIKYKKCGSFHGMSLKSVGQGTNPE